MTSKTAIIVVSGLGHTVRQGPLYPVAQALRRKHAFSAYYVTTMADKSIAQDARRVEVLVKRLRRKGFKRFILLGHSKGCYAIRQANLRGVNYHGLKPAASNE